MPHVVKLKVPSHMVHDTFSFMYCGGYANGSKYLQLTYDMSDDLDPDWHDSF